MDLRGKSAVIVGIGSLGSVAAELMAGSGIGKLILIDRDVVEAGNLERQPFFEKEDVGKPKALQAKMKLVGMNANVVIAAKAVDLNHKNLDLLEGDLIIDCTDNIETRQLINEFCIKHRKPWVHSAAIKNTGEVAVFIPEGPCYKCVFGDAKSSETCDTEGISTETSTLVSSLAAELALKILRNERPEKNLIRINTSSDEISLIKIRRNNDCPACRGNFEFITGSRLSKPVRLCGAEHYQIRGEFDFEGLRGTFAAKKDFQDFGQCFKFGKITVFNDNRALVRAETEEEARAIYSKVIGN